MRSTSNKAEGPPGGDLVKAGYAAKKLFKKGVNQMADQNLGEAISSFEQSLQIDPRNVETLLKLGYSRFHSDDDEGALRAYDEVLDIDVTNPEAWNLKGLVHYKRKDYAAALDAVEKAIESDKTYDMALYNKACYLSLLGRVQDALDALRRSIEVDVKNARKAVRDSDFENVRVEDGFRRIQEVVVLESVRQGRHTVGSVVWSTLLAKSDVDDALEKLVSRGLLVKNERREVLSRVQVYDLAPAVAGRVGGGRRSLGITRRILPEKARRMKEMIRSIQDARSAINDGDAEAVGRLLDEFTSPERSGQFMIDRFLDSYRQIRLWRARLADGGTAYLSKNSAEMAVVLDNIEAAITVEARKVIASN